MSRENNYNEFTKELATISKKYGVILNCCGGVKVLQSPEAIRTLSYDNDFTSGDLKCSVEYIDEALTYEHGIDNIFDYDFMDDFTTVILAKEEYGVDISNLTYQDEDDFYCFSEKKAYTQDELFKRFNIVEIKEQ